MNFQLWYLEGYNREPQIYKNTHCEEDNQSNISGYQNKNSLDEKK